MTKKDTMHQQDLTNIHLTKNQETVLEKMMDFVNHPTDRAFILRGYAGTGKTTLMRFLIQELEKQNKPYRLLASTGRAAKVLANLSGKKEITSTIHSMIYAFQGLNRVLDDQEMKKSDGSRQLFLVFETTPLDMGTQPETVYIVDEASMISDVETKEVTQARFGDGRLLKNLLDYDQRVGSKFIFVGDPCQLPPIEEYYSPALMEEYFENIFHIQPHVANLTEIMRQGDGSGIVVASKKIRTSYEHAPNDNTIYSSRPVWGSFPFRNTKDICLYPDVGAMLDNYMTKIRRNGLNSAVCVCRSNSACSKLSWRIRTMLGYNSQRIEKGELLMVVQNNQRTGLMNGDMVTVEEISPRTISRARLTFRQMKLKELFTGKTCSTLVIEEAIFQPQLNLSADQQQELFIDFIIRMKEKGIYQKNKEAFYQAMQDDIYLNALRCMYGYAVTCHKAQGGEWDDVYVHVPRNITLNPTKETYQWIYTAMTRAKERLHMVDDFYIN